MSLYKSRIIKFSGNFCKIMADYKENNEKLSDEVVTISNLPDEVLLIIFSKLSFTSLCRCAGVCHRWNELSKCYELRRKITIRRPLLHSQFVKLIKYHFTLDLEDFRYQPNIINYHSKRILMSSFHLKNIKRQSKYLKILVLKYCSLKSVFLDDFPKSLAHLSIEDCKVHSASFFGPYPNLLFPLLVSLDLGSVINDLNSHELYRLNALDRLKALYMEGCFRINSGGIESIHKLLQQLEILDVEGTDISNEGVIFIMNNSPKMQKLYIGHTQMDDRVFRDINLKLMPQLNYLCVLGSRITTAAFQNFFQGFVPSTELTVKTHPKNVFDFQYPLKIVAPEFPGQCKHYLSHKLNCY